LDEYDEEELKRLIFWVDEFLENLLRLFVVMMILLLLKMKKNMRGKMKKNKKIWC